jgi:hypothetical protein
MVKVAYANGRIEEVDEEDLRNLITFASYEDATFEEEYRGFKLTAICFAIGKNYPGPASHYNGYIIPNDKDPKMIEKLKSDEVMGEVYYDWTGGDDNVGHGFDCAHCTDITCSLMPFGKKNDNNLGMFGKMFSAMGLEFKGEGDVAYEFDCSRERSTFKSREWVFERLRKIADKVLEQ